MKRHPDPSLFAEPFSQIQLDAIRSVMMKDFEQYAPMADGDHDVEEQAAYREATLVLRLFRSIDTLAAENARLRFLAGLDKPGSQPMQPVVWDQHKVIRFQKNQIVDWLSDGAPDCQGELDMNEIVRYCHRANVSLQDRLQFWQLIGYSVSGYGDIFDSEYGPLAVEMIERADAEADRLSEGVEPRQRFQP